MIGKPQLIKLSKNQLIDAVRDSKLGDGKIELCIEGEDEPISLRPSDVKIGNVFIEASSDDNTIYRITAEAGSEEVFIEKRF